MQKDFVKVTLKMDRELVSEADSVFRKLGMDFSTAWNIFVRQTVRERRLPFQPTLDVKEETNQTVSREGNPFLKEFEKEAQSVNETLKEMGL